MTFGASVFSNKKSKLSVNCFKPNVSPSPRCAPEVCDEGSGYRAVARVPSVPETLGVTFAAHLVSGKRDYSSGCREQ